jgi:hypothetical protein
VQREQVHLHLQLYSCSAVRHAHKPCPWSPGDQHVLHITDMLDTMLGTVTHTSCLHCWQAVLLASSQLTIMNQP